MEIVVDSFESAREAQIAGADRIELCSNLLEGGCTPSLGLLQQIKAKLTIPTFVMLRPRGGDFLYSQDEFEIMQRNAHAFKENNADGFVFGILKADGTVDKERNQQLVDICKPLPLTFHRAFDMACDEDQTLEDVILLGFDRLLTSGREASCLEGLPTLKSLVQKAKDRIVIMPGGGITEKNIVRIREGSGAREFHWSARKTKPSAMTFQRSDVRMGGALFPAEYTIKVCSRARIEKLKTVLSS